MQKRRSHKKSRNGCQNCKNWHVKCDERRPTCTNCTLRSATCVYNLPAGHEDGGGRSSRGSLSDSDTSRRSSVGSSAPDPMRPADSESKRLLELELMHQFSTSTYRSLCCINEDHYYVQCLFPREAIEHGFPLDGLFALAALEVAVYCDNPEEAKKYINASSNYNLRAVMALREKLQDHPPHIHHLVYMLSALINVVNIAMPSVAAPINQEHHSVLERMLTIFKLLNGSRSIAQVNFNAMLNGPLPMRTLLALGPAPPEMIDPGSKDALARLSAINDELYGHVILASMEGGGLSGATGVAQSHPPSTSPSSSASPPSLKAQSQPQLQIPGEETTHEAYRKAIFYLEHCYAEDARGLKQGYCPAFSGLAGHCFADAIKQYEPLALLILAHWAVLLHRMDTDVYWYARGTGQRLALEISAILDNASASSSRPAGFVLTSPIWCHSMDWVRHQVELVPTGSNPMVIQ